MWSTFCLSEEKIGRVILSSGRCILLGILLMALPFTLPRGWGFGFLTGFMLLSRGIYAYRFRSYRTEPGIWMIALFLTITLGLSWAYFEFLYWEKVFSELARPRVARVITWNQLRLSIDAIIALALMADIVKLAMSVSIHNWKRTHGLG